ncbi:hypothetical protein QJQ45_006821 [Haematococcus lacustris]|nr:hypothetical protein QJQ45_006821 [Haematococcus lacustris]
MAAPSVKSNSKTVTDTLVGEHQHQIVGYSLVKGIGDGEPIASERFTVGGHEWVLLFYPDGKRSSSSENPGNGGAGDHAQFVPNGPPLPQGLTHPAGLMPPGHLAAPGDPANGAGGAALPVVTAGMDNPAAAVAAAAAGHAATAAAALRAIPPPHQQLQPGRRDTTNEYAALFVALIGQGPNPQGVVNTSEGKVVRAFHRFTLVDQTGQGRDLSKGRMRDAGAVKISCAGQDPNARNCHGYRKFVKRSILEEPARGFLVNDTIIIKYIIELVVSSGEALVLLTWQGGQHWEGFFNLLTQLHSGAGGALSRSTQPAGPRSDLIRVPSPNISADLAHLLASGDNADFEMVVEDEVGRKARRGSLREAEGSGGHALAVIPVHKVVLCCRSEFFKAMLCSPMREGQENRIVISDIKAPVFRALLHFIYTDNLPEEPLDSSLPGGGPSAPCQSQGQGQGQGQGMDAAMAQHLLVAADRYQLRRLTRICERRLCETIDVATVATTLTLAEQNSAEELKKVCLEFVSRNLAAVMQTDGYKHMTSSCPALQAEILTTVANVQPLMPDRLAGPSGLLPGAVGGPLPAAVAGHRQHGAVRGREYVSLEEEQRRVRARREGGPPV